MTTDPLAEIAAQLRAERTPISEHLVAAPPRATESTVVELVREGYLLHYGRPRLLAGHDPDLGLLAGDYLYALGMERLAAAGDTAAILVLADLIADSAQLHAEGRAAEAPVLWEQAIRKIREKSSVAD